MSKPSDKLTHFNAAGDAHMVDVGDKDVTHRVAVAGGNIEMLPDTFQMVSAGTHKKGDVLGIARVAGKAVDRGMQMSEIRLLKKSGGKSGDFVAS